MLNITVIMPLLTSIISIALYVGYTIHVSKVDSQFPIRVQSVYTVITECGKELSKLRLLFDVSIREKVQFIVNTRVLRKPSFEMHGWYLV